MKRVGRWLFNFAAAVSVVMCLVTGMAWLRSYFQRDALRWGDEDIPGLTSREYQLSSHNGVVGVYVNIVRRPDWIYHSDTALRYESDRAAKIGIGSLLSQLFAIYLSPRDGEYIDHYGTIQAWRLLLVSYLPLCLCWVTLPLWWLWTRKRSGETGGLCAKCGYDLRATPARCPECGAIPPAAKGSAT